MLCSRPPADVSRSNAAVPKALDQLISRCLSKESVDRPSTVKTVKTALETIVLELPSDV